jgi:hypothetical protein
MKIKSFSFKHNPPVNSGINDTILSEINMDLLNLIVGKNAVGKSRVLRVISAFAELINQKSPVFKGNWNFNFISDEGKDIKYNVFCNDIEISEELIVNNQHKLTRSNEEANLYSETARKMITINPPKDKLVLHIRRDNKEFPFFEDLIKWSEGTHYFRFGNIHPNDFLQSDRIRRGLTSIDSSIPRLLKDFNGDEIRLLINEFNSLGYGIQDIIFDENVGKGTMFIKETLLNFIIPQNFISQGMFRALSLIILINYLISKSVLHTLVVDDICEGMDYERATKLGKIIFGRMERENIQFIASSNDSFLMDTVDIKYWNVLKRKGEKITSLNYSNSKLKFDKFKYTGLTNFDFFSSDYLLEK